MFAEIEAVVAGEHEHGIFRDAQLVERLEQAADVVIHGRERAKIVAVHFAGAGRVRLRFRLGFVFRLGLLRGGGELAAVGRPRFGVRGRFGLCVGIAVFRPLRR